MHEAVRVSLLNLPINEMEIILTTTYHDTVKRIISKRMFGKFTGDKARRFIDDRGDVFSFYDRYYAGVRFSLSLLIT